jgi:hypothetical protein
MALKKKMEYLQLENFVWKIVVFILIAAILKGCLQ